MNIKQSTLAAAVTATLVMGVSGEAAASVYAGSSLEIQNLQVVITENGAVSPQPIQSFLFTSTNTANLNGGVVASSTATCGSTGPFPANDCNTTTPRLDPGPANAAGSAPLRANNDFSLFGPGANQYSNSDSVIYVSELTLDGPTHQQQIAESELQGGSQAAANSEIQSTTGINMIFQIAGTGDLTISWEADPYLRAAINDPTFVSGAAQSNMQVIVTLTDPTGNQAQWQPQGSVANDCTVDAGFTGTACTETADGTDLNRSFSAIVNGQDLQYSVAAGFSNFGISFTGLLPGIYSLNLDSLTSVQVRRVPEPGMLALMGMGLLGMGVASRRRKARG